MWEAGEVCLSRKEWIQRLRGPSRRGMSPEFRDSRGGWGGALASPACVLGGPHLHSHLCFFQSRGQAQAPQQT